MLPQELDLRIYDWGQLASSLQNILGEYLGLLKQLLEIESKFAG
jgi:hypothetical protein